MKGLGPQASFKGLVGPKASRGFRGFSGFSLYRVHIPPLKVDPPAERVAICGGLQWVVGAVDMGSFAGMITGHPKP